MQTQTGAGEDFDLVLVLSGGNALAAFQAGVYQALHEYGLEPTWVVGTSMGAVNAALIAGSHRENRLDTLRSFWRPAPASSFAATPWFPPGSESWRRTGEAIWTLMAGRIGVFGPLLSAAMPWSGERPSLFETDQLAATAERLIDFARLNNGECRFTATAVDLETGEDIIFDSGDTRIEPAHLRASGALPVTFPPVQIDGRWLVDGGLSANLPLDPVLAATAQRPTLCVAVDLLPLHQALPRSLGEAASRMQDLLFAAQSRRTIAAWQAVHRDRADFSISLARLTYDDQAEEVAGKAMDFSGETVRERWTAGHRAGVRLTRRIAAGALAIGAPGLRVHSC